MNTNTQSKSVAALTLGAIGVVYGDIGTSPLYTIKEIFSTSTGIALTQTNIIGAISAVFWALMLVVTLKYVILVLRADNRGEGGIMALLALAVSTASKAPKRKKILLALDKAIISENTSKIESLNNNIEELKSDKNKIVETLIYLKVEELLPYLKNKKSHRAKKEKCGRKKISPEENIKIDNFSLVNITLKQYQTLIIKYGEMFVKKALEILDNWLSIGSSETLKYLNKNNLLKYI